MLWLRYPIFQIDIIPSARFLKLALPLWPSTTGILWITISIILSQACLFLSSSYHNPSLPYKSPEESRTQHLRPRHPRRKQKQETNRRKMAEGGKKRALKKEKAHLPLYPSHSNPPRLIPPLPSPTPRLHMSQIVSPGLYALSVFPITHK